MAEACFLLPNRLKRYNFAALIGTQAVIIYNDL